MFRKRFLFLLIVMLMPFCVLAEGEEVTLTCPDEILKGNQIVCKISLNSSNKIKGVLANYGVDNVFSYLDTKFSDTWEEVVSHNQGFTIVNTDGVTSGEVGALYLLLSNDAVIGNEYKVTLKDIVLSDGEKDILVEDKEEVVKVLSILDVVDSIFVNDIELEVKDGVTDYTIEVENSVEEAKLNVNLESDQYQFVSGYGSRVVTDLKVGDNLYQVKIMDLFDQELVTYSIHVIRKDVANEEESVQENPKTGNSYVLFCVGVLVISLLVLIFSKKWLRRDSNG